MEADHLRIGGLTDADLLRMSRYSERIQDLPYRFVCDPSMTIQDIHALATLEHKRGQCDVLLVDYLQAFNAEVSRGETLDMVIGRSMLRLGWIACELNCAAVVVSQLNREGKRRGEKGYVPMIHDLRDSSSIEQAADSVLILDRPEKHGILQDSRGVSMVGMLKIYILKDRNGATGYALRFVMEKEGCDFKQALRICEDICGLSSCRDGAYPRLNPSNNPSSNGGSDQAGNRANNPKLPPDAGETAGYAAAAPSYPLLPYDPGHPDLRLVYTAFGVALAPANSSREYAFTRGRLVFPIHDAEGRPVAFAARYLGDTPPRGCLKYLNSPTSPLYKKDGLLYGWHQAVASIRATATVILVEGYKDCLAMHATGFTHTVALCGLNLSDDHIRLIRASALTVCLFLDDDAPGRAAAGKILARLQAIPRLAVYHAHYPDLPAASHKDPDELFRALGKAPFRRLLSGRMIAAERRQAEDDLVATCLACPIPPPNPAILRDEQGRRSRQLRLYFLRYLEIRLADRVRRHSFRLSRPSPDAGERIHLLHALQYERDYLRDISKELNRG